MVHVQVFAASGEKGAQESDLLASAWDVQDNSRLSCQVKVTPQMDGMKVRFPSIIVNKKKNTAGVAANVAAPLEINRVEIKPKKFKNLTKSAIPRIFEELGGGNPALADGQYRTLANILPFRTNNYVVEELIDWADVPNDPIFQLTFPQPGMLEGTAGVEEVAAAMEAGASPAQIRSLADKARASLNPHPAKQQTMNVPNSLSEGGSELIMEPGMQHKYRETVLFFPSESQYCHSYCTYCFRWAQFTGSADNQFASNDADNLMAYLRGNPSVSDLLVTGGDPMVLNSKQLGRYLDAVSSDPALEHVQTVRIGSKSLAYWPYKYVTDDDADDMLRLLERTVQRGKHVSLMAHFSHPAELRTPVVQEAIRRIRATGTQIRCQAPLTDHINNDPDVWAAMWREQVRLGMVPYYMFVERDTGAKNWFGVPLARALDVYHGAMAQSSGLARTARGPSMSCTPGKVHVLGVETVAGEKVFVLKFLQGRNPAWTDRVFFAQFDPEAQWMDQLKPAFGQERFFFEDELDRMEEAALLGSGSSGQLFQAPSADRPSLEPAAAAAAAAV